MKPLKRPFIYVSLTSLALIFSLAGCTHSSTTEPKSETLQTGQAEVREMTENTKAQMAQMATQSKTELTKMASAGKAGFQELSQKAEQSLNRIAASSDEALKGVGLQTGYNAVEKEQFLTGCKQACAKESKTTGNIARFCELYCGCTHDNLQSKIAFEDLQDYTVGKASNTASKKIEQIRNQCLQDANTTTNPSIQ